MRDIKDTKDIQFKITYKGIKDKSVKYDVLINGKPFKFFTGLGWIKYTKTKGTNYHVINFQMLPSETQVAIQATLGRKTYIDRKFVYAQIPTLDCILEHLFLESWNVDKSFEEWCLEYDLSTDSIKAKNTYQQCVEDYFKLKKALGEHYETIKQELTKAGGIDG